MDGGQYDLAIAELDNTISQYTYAVADLNKAIGLNYHFTEAIENLAVSYNDRGHAYDIKREWDLAISDLSRAIDLDRDLADAYHNLGWAYNGKRNYDKAIPELTRAIKLDPDMVLAYNNRGWAYHETKQYDLAIIDWVHYIYCSWRYELQIDSRCR